MMFRCEEYAQLLYKLDTDLKYKRIANRYQRMEYFVRQRHRNLAQFGEKVLNMCADYRRKHGKSQSSAVNYINYAKMHARKQNQFYDAIQMWNNALKNLPQCWSNWSQMHALLDIYVTRAVEFFQRSFFDETYQDLKHASSIVKNFTDRSTMTKYFATDCGLLTTMVAIKFYLLDNINIDSQKGALEQVLKQFGLTQIMSNSTKRQNVAEVAKNLCLVNISTLYDILELTDKLFHQCETEKHLMMGDMKENFIIHDKIRLNYTDDGGRCYVANDHIYDGESLLQERAVSLVMFNDNLFDYCSTCHQSMATFWPCSGCTELGFCSYECEKLAANDFHKHECGIYGMILGKENFYSLAHVFRLYSVFGITTMMECENELLQQKLKLEKSQLVAAFDIEQQYIQNEAIRVSPIANLNDENKVKVCRSIVTLLHHRGKRDFSRESSHTILSFAMIYFLIDRGLLKRNIINDYAMFSRMAEHLSTAMLRTCTNGFCWAEEREKIDRRDFYNNGIDSRHTNNQREMVKVASCICFVASFFNHSCDPNVNWAISESGIRLKAVKPIQPGDMLTICYGPKKWNEFNQRQSRLRDDYCFFCRCDVCRKDVARSGSTLRCMATPRCDGPLVLNKYDACLFCGQSPYDLVRARDSVDTLERTYGKFMKILSLLTACEKSNSRTKAKNVLLACVKQGKKYLNGSPNNAQNDNCRTMKQQVTSRAKVNDGNGWASEKGKNNNLLKENYPKLCVSEKKLAKLEKYLKLYQSKAYPRSYNLFDMCSLMLYVYNQLGTDKKGLQLVDTISNCLDDIFPELTDQDLVNLVYKLDYMCKFFDNLSQINLDRKKIKVNMQSNANGEGLIDGDHNNPVSFEFADDDPVVPFSKFWCLVQKLNSKLLDILRYDMQYRGHFYPKLHLKLIENSANDDENIMLNCNANITTNIAASSKLTKNSKQKLDVVQQARVTSFKLGSDERYFKKVYEDCQRRFTTIDKLVNRS